MQTPDRDAPLWPLLFSGVVLSVICWQLLDLSIGFGYEHAQITRPLLRVLSLFASAFFVHLFALRYSLRVNSKYLTLTIVSSAILFRAILVCSTPIQEIDIYRYIWDGHVSLSGVSPFEFSPHEVLHADDLHAAAEAPLPIPADLEKLVARRDASQGLYEVLSRIHFGELPTVYPPVSQIVFAIAAWSTPANASLETHLFVMKLWLLLFDIGTLCFVALTLARAKMNVGWLVTYAWSPLVLKEFANSGHLDSIAVCFTAAAIYFVLKAFFDPAEVMVDYRLPYADFWNAVFASILLALAVGAKLYPVVLVPILTFTAWKQLGPVRTLAIGTVFVLVTALCLAPMFQSSDRVSVDQVTAETTQADRQAGLKAFLSGWMMNDLIFLNLIENATPDQLRPPNESTPWFVVMPNSVRASLINTFVRLTGVEESKAPFRIARTTTAMIFVALAIWFSFQATKCATAAEWLEFVFLTMVWFWLLLPTLNPWYLIWALPWIAFAKNRAWLALSGLVFIYYLRFHFGAHYPDERVIWLFDAKGEAFFDYVIVWAEYVPWFIVLFFVYWIQRAQTVGITVNAENGLKQTS